MKVVNHHNNLAESIASLYEIPIPLEEIIEDEGLILYCDDYGANTFDGLTIYEPNQDVFYIHLNSERGNNIAKPKGRFTLAHELGHYFIDRHRLAMMSGEMQPHCHFYNPFGKNEEWKIEREADDFAASLLMPSNLLHHDIGSCQISGDLIKQLSKKYMVSFSAMAIRFLHLDILPMMVVYAEDGKVKWQLHSEDFPFWRLRYGNSRLPENSVIGSYFYDNDVDSCNKDEIVFAGDCFHVTDQESVNMEFYEYCIPYKDKAFSVFWTKF